MSPRRFAPFGIHLSALLFALRALAQTTGGTLDFTAPLHPKDNFVEASFRYINPDPQTAPTSVLVFIPGTDGDGRGTVTDPKFLAICRACHAALMGVYFRGEGLSYDDPSGGSGRAIDEALAYFAAQSHRSLVAHAPLFFVGFSQGGMFTFNYICWRPEQVKAFAALKAIIPRLSPKAASFKVPGFLAAGENDDPGRIRSIAKTFTDATGKHSKWAFLYERGSGHDMGHCVELAGELFEALSAEGGDTPVLMDSETGNPVATSSKTAGASWFPNQQVADFWKPLNKPMPLQSLITTADRPSLQNFVSAASDTETFVAPNGGSQDGLVTVTVNNPDAITSGVKISGDGFNVGDMPAGKIPSKIGVRFAPQGLNWGHVRGDLEILGNFKGQEIGSLHVSLSGMVKGSLVPIPSVVYLGVIGPGEVSDQSVILRSDKSSVQVTKVEVPDGITATIDPAKPGETDLFLRVHWTTGARLGHMEGEILVTVNSPEKGTLRIPIFGTIDRPKP